MFHFGRLRIAEALSRPKWETRRAKPKLFPWNTPGNLIRGVMLSKTAAQLLLTGVPGKTLDPETAERFRRLQPGGYILFGRNIESPTQLRQLIDDLRDLSDIEPIITIDQEGGRVSRLRLIGEEPPNAQQLRKHGDIDLIREHGQLTGQLLRQFGFNLDLCPVLDLSFDDEADNSLKGRCYGTTPEEVIRNAGAFNDGMRKAGVLSCGKHFPGYAAAQIDPHHELPVIERSRETLENEELRPFRELLPELDSMMVCHSGYPCFGDGKTPASLSDKIVKGLLRNEMGYRGLIMTDDLDMGAILNDYAFDDTIRLALHAGNDLIMICHRLEMVEEAHRILLEQADPAEIERAAANVQRFKESMSAPAVFDEAEFTRINAAIWDLRVNVLGEQGAAAKSVEDGKRSPVELY